MMLLLMLACAKQGMPPGGPVDETPPEVIQTIPISGETMVDPRVSVQIWFSERIEPKSASDAIFISPFVGEDVKYQFRNRRARIIFPEPLETNLTFVITLGTGIKDYRNNALETSYTLAFSTGPVLDQGEITGQIHGIENASGIDVWAYTLGDSSDPNPSIHEPKYIVQCETQGGFKFSHIAPGLYRLFAVRDRMADRLYQDGEDEVGVTSKDVLLSLGRVLSAEGLNFRMALKDTVGPSIVRAVSLDRHHLMLRLDEPISSRHGLPSGSLTMVSADDNQDTLSFHYSYVDPMSPQMLHILTQAQTDGEKYELSLQDLWDEAGNPIDTAYSTTFFTGVAAPDTTIPNLILVDPQPGTKLLTLDGPIRLVFSEVMDTTEFGNGLIFGDTLGLKIEGAIKWKNPSEVLFQSTDRLKSQTTYEIGLFGNGVMDPAGNSLADTLFRFQTLNSDTLSEIAGKIIDSDSSAVGEIHVIAHQIENSGITYLKRLSEPGIYHFTGVLPGQYLLECFRDSDGNGRYSMGNPFPFEFSERFVVYMDTVKVRSRWPNEGNDIILPR